MGKKVFLLAGEASGDMYGAYLVKALRQALPVGSEIYAMGGRQLYEAGANIVADPTSVAVVGFWEVLAHLEEFRHIFRTVKEAILKIRPDIVIYVDYPGFNLRMAGQVKKHLPDIKQAYFISPQVWAWKRKRINLIKRTIDKMFVIFPFEQGLYEKSGIKSQFVGHPLADILAEFGAGGKDAKTAGQRYVLLLPGSRMKEVEKHLPVFLKAALLLKKEVPDIRFALNMAPHIPEYVYQRLVRNAGIELQLVQRQGHHTAIRDAFCVWLASGTATMECAYFEKPMIAVYKTSILTYALLRPIVRVKYISMPNILLDSPVVDELVQWLVTPQNILRRTRALFDDVALYESKREALASLKRDVFIKGAFDRTAWSVMDLIKEKGR